MKLSLVILTCNEIVGLRALYDRIPFAAVDEVLAVDWNSSDGTVEFLKSHGVRVIQQEVKGRGEAFRVAFQHTIGDALIFFGPDGNETPEDISRFRKLLEAGNEIVIGNRMSNGGRNEEDDQLLKVRKWVNQGFTLVANLIWNRNHYVHDTINGFRAIHRDTWTKLSPNGSGYTIEYQTSIRAFKNKTRIAEFPTYEGNRIDEREGSPGMSTGLAFLKLFFRELRS